MPRCECRLTVGSSLITLCGQHVARIERRAAHPAAHSAGAALLLRHRLELEVEAPPTARRQRRKVVEAAAAAAAAAASAPGWTTAARRTAAAAATAIPAAAAASDHGVHLRAGAQDAAAIAAAASAASTATGSRGSVCRAARRRAARAHGRCGAVRCACRSEALSLSGTALPLPMLLQGLDRFGPHRGRLRRCGRRVGGSGR
jgi:hypothetical protein